MNTTAVNARMREVAAEANRIVETKGLSNSQKMAALDRLDVERKSLVAQIDANERAASFGSLSSISGRDAEGTASKSATSAAPLHFDTDQARYLFKSAADGVGVSIKALPSTTASIDPATHSSQVFPPVAIQREPTRILDLIPTTATTTNVQEYYVASQSGTGAGAVAEGAQKPDSQLSLTKATVSATKLAVWSEATEEALTDFPAFQQYLQAELISEIIDAENHALLSASGTAPSTFKGILNTSGIQTVTDSGSYVGLSPLDLLGVAMDGLRAGGRYVEATGIVMHPTMWGSIRRSKGSGDGQYLIGAPTLASNLTIWGVPVVLTSQVGTNTMVVGNFAQAATVYVRSGLTVRSNANGAGFRNNVTEFVAEERLALAVTAPSALSVVTFS